MFENMPGRLIALKISLYAMLVAVFVLAVLPADVQLPEVLTISDVLNHALAFFVISILFDVAHPALGVAAKIGLIAAYGMAIEIAQSFVPTRECSLVDFAVDLAATALFFAASRAAVQLLPAKGAVVKKDIVRGLAAMLVAGFGLGCSTAGSHTAARTAAGNQAATTVESERTEPVAISEFILGTGDEINIAVYRHDDLTKTVAVPLDGKTMFPLIGDLQLAGRSVFSLRDEMTAKLSKFLVKPEVTITVTAIKSRKTLVLGEVKSPGYFLLDTETSVLDLLSKAGGTSNDADLEKVLLIRKVGGRMTETPINIKKLLAGGDDPADRPVQNGDIVLVPTRGIASAARYLSYVSDILRPFVSLEGGIVLAPLVRDVFTGGETSPGVTVPTQ